MTLKKTVLQLFWPSHYHQISDVTTFNDGHRHRIQTRTGPDIQVRGGHVHRYETVTTYEDGHTHYTEGYTSVH